MDVFERCAGLIAGHLGALIAEGELPNSVGDTVPRLEPPRDPAHGDLASNIALVLAKPARRKPREIAEALAGRLDAEADLAEVAVAGPGFLNLRLADDVWRAEVRAILAAGADYGRAAIGGGEKVNVEYVSANPTGPLHVGHLRGAVYGDVLANLLQAAGFDVCKEYYINDAGVQVDTLARSAYLRYREALGEAIGEIPPGMYPGDYLKAVGAALAQRDGKRWRDAPETEWLEPVRQFAVDALMDEARRDLADLGVEQAVFFSERSLHRNRRTDEALADLERRGLIYTGVLEPPKGKTPEDWEPRPQTLFRATAFGDDVDRPLRKSDGAWTYFAADIAYHFDKFQRGFTRQIDVWGADHGGYVKRMKAAVTALSDGAASLDVRICQLVRVLRDGEPVRMSKRAGDFITIREVLDEVGKDVTRFLMLTRKNDAPLDFDFVKVREQSKDNPVFYVQYAHARICSVLRNAGEILAAGALADERLGEADLGHLAHSGEIELIKLLAQWPRTLAGAALAHEPHRLAFYLHDLAAAFHGQWNRGNDDLALRFLRPDDAALTLARLALLRATQTVIQSGLAIMAVRPLEEMH